MFGPLSTGDTGQEFVFPDWSPYRDLREAIGAYFRDPDVAWESLEAGLGDRSVLGFSLERMVSDEGLVWQEAVVCDGGRILLWHGEDIAAEEFGEGTMTSALRVVPLERVSEVGYRQLLTRGEDGQRHLRGVDVYVLLESIDESAQLEREGESFTVYRHDSIRLGKSVEQGGHGQVQRLIEFARLVSGMAGVARR